MKEVEYNYISGSPAIVFESLNRGIGQYKRNNNYLKIGITGRIPQKRFDEHLREYRWQRMVVIYKTSSINFANKIEDWLIEKHYDDLFNKRKGGGSDLSPDGYNFVYVLLA